VNNRVKNRVDQIVKVINGIDFGEGLPAGTLIASMLEVRLNASRRLLISSLWSFYHLLFARGGSHYLYESNFVQRKKSDKEMVLLGISGNSDRLFDFIAPFLERKEKVNFSVICPKVLSKGLSHSRTIVHKRESPFRSIFLTVLRKRSLSLYERLVCIVCLSIQLPKYSSLKMLLIEEKVAMIIVDHDRNPGMIPLILAGQNLSIRTVTLVHGSISPIDNYIPVVADCIWVWGEYQREKFMNYGVSDSRIKIVGNPKLEPNKLSHNFDNPVIGVGNSPLSRDQFDSFFSLLLKLKANKIMVKKHPLTSIEDYREVSDWVNILSENVDVEAFFQKITVLIVERSQLGSDALLWNIPVVVVNVVGLENLQNGLLLNREAGCPIIDNADDLEIEIDRLHQDKKYRALRLKRQNEMTNRLYAYTGTDVKSMMMQQIEQCSLN
jgi:hypothetical protein